MSIEPCTRVSFRYPAAPGERFGGGAAESLIGTTQMVTAFGDRVRGRVIQALVVDDGAALWITIEGCGCEH
jgi:hypothetical protein